MRPDFERDHLAALSQLGAVSLQIGVETLVDSHLARMKKGQTVAENIRALEACSELGLPVTWGVFVKLPGETRDELRLLLQRCREWTHLPPPKYVTECEVRSGSPLWDERRALGLAFEFPWRAFDVVLPPRDSNVEFLPSLTRRGSDDFHRDVIEEIRSAVDEWQREWESCRPRSCV